jgi:integrase
LITIGIDPHKDTHTAAAVADATGQLLGELTIPGTAEGHERLLVWAHELAGEGGELRFALEDCRHVNGRLERFLLGAEQLVLRVGTRLTARERNTARTYGKSDSIDALAVARAALREPNLPRATHDPKLRELKLLVDHREDLVGERTAICSRLRWLSAMAEDAITDEVADLNPFKGVRVRANDPRAKKKRRPIRVFSFEEMHRFAKAAGRYEAMVRVFTDTGMRLGEVLPLRREDFDGETLKVRRTAHEGTILDDTKTDHGEHGAGRTVPVPATLAWMLEAQISLNGPGCDLLFTTPTGRMWRERNFYRDVWKPAQQASGLDIRPHECRHSYVTHLRAAGVNDADLAEIAGHRVETMLARYTHPVGDSFAKVRGAIG